MRQERKNCSLSPYDFNPLTHKEWDLLDKIKEILSSEISIHSLIKSETWASSKTDVWAVQISIHSLIKSETFERWKGLRLDWISIHSLIKSETSLSTSIMGKTLYFNPLTHKEWDVDQVPALSNLKISIHSLIKSETKNSVNTQDRVLHFNPLTHKEWDSHNSYFILFFKYFNPLTHKEWDLVSPLSILNL